MSKSKAPPKAVAGKKSKSKYDYSKGPAPLNINLTWCKACNICIALCPTQVFEPDSDGKPVLARPDDCNQCTVCWTHCPDFAITSNYK
ncbi:MAG: 4Fe-4S dicluster domain-containing protein [candidate division Zixibacteria bacterium]|nr:4Fe-4S dicluster domain-containing protein [candidate division Zixibacteria bacterium]